MAVDEVANRLNTQPSEGRSTERLPGEIEQFTVDFTIAARQKEGERFDRQIPNIMLLRVRYVAVQFAWILDNSIVQKTNDTRRGVDSSAMVPKIVHIFLDRQPRFCPEVLRFNEIPFARGVNVQDIDHRGRT